MSTFIVVLGWFAFAVGVAAILFGVWAFIHVIFIARGKAQSQCPYCTKVWKDETVWLEWWHDHVSFPLHIRQTPYHKERHGWFKRDRNQYGLTYAIQEQRARILAGVEKPLAKRMPAYWETWDGNPGVGTEAGKYDED